MKRLTTQLIGFFLTIALAGLFLIAPVAVRAATVVVVNNDSAGEGFNDLTPVATVGGNSGTTIGAQRLNAFQYAANIWGARLASAVPIRVRAQFDPLECTATSAVLGHAGPMNFLRDFTGAPLSATYYPIALANALNGSDLDPGRDDIDATFSSTIGSPGCMAGSGWYYGLDANPSSGKLDFASVLIHELGHGLGFLTLVDLATGQKPGGANDTFMRNLEAHGASPSDYPSMSNAQRVAASMNTGNLHWVGAKVRAASSVLAAGQIGDHVRMYAPNSQESGSSVSHFDTALTPNQIMEPSYTVALHNPVLELPLFEDIGWTLISGTSFTLSVAKFGTGTGTVSSSPAGISCGADCTESYASGTSVTLTAAADLGSTFSGWGGSCSGSSSTCTVSMTAAKSVTASFATSTTNRLISVTKSGTGTGTVISSPSGINCGSVCATTFAPTSSVALTATASSGSTFAGWTGACSGTGGCTVAAGTTLVSIGAVFNLASSGSVTPLQNGVALANLSGATGSSALFSITVPSGATNLLIKTTGGAGDLDMYVRFGQLPTTSAFDCVSGNAASAESCAVSTPTAGTYYVLLDGFAAYSGVTLTASYTAPGGGSGNITGTAGNDTLTNSSGNNTVDGLGGIDTYVSSGVASSFNLVASGGVWTLTDTVGAQGIDSLRNIERLRFSNGVHALDVGKGQIGGMAHRIYKAAFNRLPDNGGLKYWMGQMESGMSLPGVAAGFIASPEFTIVYGNNVSNSDFVNRLYQNVLSRPAEPAGFDYWMNQLAIGVSRPDVLVGFSESDENINAVAPTIAHGIWLPD